MDIFFQDPTVIPLPPNEVRVKELRAEIWSDNRRVRIYLELTPFQKRPNGEITIVNPSGEEVASASIIETITAKMELTMHLRGSISTGQYQVSASIFYEEPAEGEEAEEAISPPKRIVVDSAKTVFSIQA
jgi:hypothetical protein